MGPLHDTGRRCIVKVHYKKKLIRCKQWQQKLVSIPIQPTEMNGGKNFFFFFFFCFRFEQSNK